MAGTDSYGGANSREIDRTCGQDRSQHRAFRRAFDSRHTRHEATRIETEDRAIRPQQSQTAHGKQ